jgi:hypothetical protein
MYNYYYCSKLNDEFYDHKLDLNKLSYLIDKYDLKFIGEVKEYWLNNIQIISSDIINFHRIIDKDINYSNNYIIHEYDKFNCDKFNFSESHQEDIFDLYENTLDNVKIIIKKYDNYFTLHYESQNNIDNNFLYYI